MADVVIVPDESGMGYEERMLGEPFYDPDCGRWLVQVDQFYARAATLDEIARATNHKEVTDA